MTTKELVTLWFKIWKKGNFNYLTLSEDFKHTSPYGTIERKNSYLSLVEANKNKFLGHRFEIHDALYAENKACIYYTAIKDDFRLDVSE